MKSIFLTLTLLFAGVMAFAQNKASVSGIVFDASGSQVLPFVNVHIDNDSGEIISGSISGDKGIFVLNDVPEGDWTVKLSYIGYEAKEELIHIGELNSNYSLGKIKLVPLSVVIQGIDVSAEKATVSAGMQKKTFELGKNNVAQAGGSVLKAIQNLVGVTVNSDGVVSLRGNHNVLVLIDGKQSSLTGFGTQSSLDNIPASNVARIEIINNPSAKYEAKGNAGIINIIYKKEIEKGFNGELGMAAGLGELTNNPADISVIAIQDKYSFTPKVSPNFLLNYRSDKVNYFVQADGMVRKKINCNMFTERYYNDGRVTNQQFSEMREQALYNVKFGMDWFINDKDKFTVYGLWQDEYHADHGDVPYIYDQASTNNRLWEWTEDEDTKFMNFSALYSHNFVQPGHTLDAAYNFTGGREDELFPFSDKYFDTSGKQLGETHYDQTHLFVWEYVHNLTLDYVKPLRTGRFETGLFANFRSIPVDYDIYPGYTATGYMANGLGVWSEYTENIVAAYGNYIFESKKLEVELGLRLAQTFVNYQLDEDNIYYKQQNKENYFKFYPNLRFTYKINPANKLSVFYSKRVDHPNEFQLRPFPKYDDPEVLRTGNPALTPQYTKSAELAYKFIWESGSFFAAAYHKWISDIISRTAIADPTYTNIINYVPENLGDGSNAGFELVFEQQLAKWWTFDANFNWYNNTIDAFSGETFYPDPNGIAFNFDEESNDTWNMKANSNIDLENGFGAQLSFIYYAKDIAPQTELSSHYGFNVGISKSIMKDKGEIYLNGNDIFNTDKVEQIITGDGFSMIRKDYVETQVFMLGFKYKF